MKGTAQQTSIISYSAGSVTRAALKQQVGKLFAFKTTLCAAKSESDLEKEWYKALTTYWPENTVVPVQRPGNVKHDTLLRFAYPERLTEEFYVMFEFKTDAAIPQAHKQACAKALIQCMYYHHEIDLTTAARIRVFVIATNTRVWWFPSALVNVHGSTIINWKVKGGASSAWKENRNILLSLTSDDKLKSFFESPIRISDALFTLDYLREHIRMCAQSAVFRQPLDITNAFQWFAKFREYVFQATEAIDQVEDTPANEKTLRNQMGAFGACIRVGLDFNALIRDNRFIVYRLNDDDERKVKMPGIDATHRLHVFVGSFDAVGNDVRQAVYSQYDSLLQKSVTRHRKGDYYTPARWVEAACAALDSCISFGGAHVWSRDCIVWDASCGTGNLTAQREFSHLFQTTIFAEDINALRDRACNRNARLQAQFDFLSSPTIIPTQLSEYLRTLPELPLVFLNNPPFKTSGVYKIDAHNVVQKHANVSKTEVGSAMAADGYSAQQLHVQFLYKLTRIAMTKKNGNRDIYNAIFLPTNAWCGSSNAKFLTMYAKHWEFLQGFVFPGMAFDGTEGVNWGVSFTVWKMRKPPLKATTLLSFNDECRWLLDVRAEPDCGGGSGVPVFFIPVDANNKQHQQQLLINDWCHELLLPSAAAGAKKMQRQFLPLSTGLTLAKMKKPRTAMPTNAVGFLLSDGNSVNTNAQQVAMFTSVLGRSHGIAITSQHAQLLRACATFFVRRSVRVSWRTYHLEQLGPCAEISALAEFRAWSLNCLVFALFESKSQQTALRGVRYRTTVYDVRNEFFFHSRKAMLELATRHRWSAMLDDLDTSPVKSDTLVHVLLTDNADKLVPEAQALLKKGQVLIEETFAARRNMAKVNVAGVPVDSHLQCWDAGWYQIKYLLDADAKKQMKLLRYQLGARLWDGIFAYGFLPVESQRLFCDLYGADAKMSSDCGFEWQKHVHHNASANKGDDDTALDDVFLRIAIIESVDINPRRDEHLKRMDGRLAVLSLVRVAIEGDGSCQFSALFDQLQRQAVANVLVTTSSECRARIVSWLLEHGDNYTVGTEVLSDFKDTYSTWKDYCQAMGTSTAWGNHITLVAAAECFGVAIQVISSHENEKYASWTVRPRVSTNKTLTLAFWCEWHYDSTMPIGSASTATSTLSPPAASAIILAPVDAVPVSTPRVVVSSRKRRAPAKVPKAKKPLTTEALSGDDDMQH